MLIGRVPVHGNSNLGKSWHAHAAGRGHPLSGKSLIGFGTRAGSVRRSSPGRYPLLPGFEVERSIEIGQHSGRCSHKDRAGASNNVSWNNRLVQQAVEKNLREQAGRARRTITEACSRAKRARASCQREKMLLAHPGHITERHKKSGRRVGQSRSDAQADAAVLSIRWAAVEDQVEPSVEQELMEFGVPIERRDDRQMGAERQRADGLG